MTPRASAIAAPEVGNDDQQEVDSPTGSWTDLMPMIPLVRGVPVLRCDGEAWTVIEDQDGCNGVLCAQTDEVADIRAISIKDLVVDLNAAIGVGYALRFVRMNYPMALAHFMKRVGPSTRLGPMELVAERWLNGETTDRDRLLLAASLAEMSRMSR